MDMTSSSGRDDFPAADSLLGPFLQEADDFLRMQIGQETYQKFMGCEAGQAHPYVAARILLNPGQWNKYLWISHHGSLSEFRSKGE